MEGIAQYVFSVICAAAVCSLVQFFFQKSGYLESLMKLLTGLVLSVVVLGPVVNMETLNLDSILKNIPGYEDTAVNDGKEQARIKMGQIIQERTQAYILGQAGELGANVTVEVTVSLDEPPVPTTVVIAGDISPYARKRLGSILVTDLGIAEENQIWI